jgi:glycosyltransferase involved in cell wall biosynthesis
MRTPEVSVIVPVYNGERYIASTLKRAVEQSTHEVAHEVIIVNDGSTDQTRAILHREDCNYPRGILRILDQDNQGPSGAINTGIEFARGRIVIICDADDLLDPNAVEAMGSALRNTFLVVAEKSGFSNNRTIYTSNKEPRLTQARGSNNFKDHYLLHANWIGHPIAVMRRALELLGGYNKNIRIAQDYDLCLRLVYPQEGYRDFRLLPWPLYFHRYHSNSLSANNRDQQLKEAISAILDTLRRLGISGIEPVAGGRDKTGLLYFDHKAVNANCEA